MVAYSLVLSLALATTSALATPLFSPPHHHPHPPSPSVPVGRRDPKGLGALAKRKKRYFGCAFDVNHIPDEPYTQLVLSQFSQLSSENSLKWETVGPSQGTFNYTNGDILVKTAQKNKMTFRAHVLVWHSQLPAWVSGGGFSRDALIDIMKSHIMNVAGRYRGKISAWDVVNEVFNEDGTYRSTVFYDTIGPEFIDIAFLTAKKADPFSILAINDYNIDGPGPKSSAMIDLVTSARARRVPIEQIGAQAHLIVGSLPAGIKENWQAFADTGASVAITEIDIRMPIPATPESLAQQAADYKTVVSACLAVRKCVALTIWGASDKYSWVPGWFEGEGSPLPWDEDLNPKPALAAIVEALKA